MTTQSVTSKIKLTLVVLIVLCPLSAFGFAPETIIVRWNNTALQAIREMHSGPPQAARMLVMTHTCMYDAWAAYDTVAYGTRWVPSCDVR